MSDSRPWIAIPAEAAQKIEKAEAAAGEVRLREVVSANIYVPLSITVSKGLTLPVSLPKEFKALSHGDRTVSGQWVKMPATGINLLHLDSMRRGDDLIVPFADFKRHVPQVCDPGNMTGLMITYDPDIPESWQPVGVTAFGAWLVRRDGVRPIRLAIEPEWGLVQLEGRWPVEELHALRAMVVGVGSIGGAATQALASYGVGTIRLIDPDRFLWHNIVRHVLAEESVGLYKVDAMKRDLEAKWPRTTVDAYRYDVVDDAHLVRPLISDVDVILCAADGIASRRVVSHLARRANKPAVLACVLDNGSVAEIARLLASPRFGCLLCLRAHLRQEGAMDVEAAQELDYGTGLVHLPMTAIGPDLQLVGQLAAKVAVATLMESHLGDHTQRLPDNLATIGLRPPGDMAAPFDLNRALDIKWSSLPPPRPGCPTCGS